MTQHLVILLAYIVALEAARYGDYTGVRMPHYNIEYENKEPAPLTDEYSDRSPDAAPSFDYKYEEESREKVGTDEDHEWQKISKRRKMPLNEPSDKIEIDESDPPAIPKFKPNHRYPKHRTRIKDVHGQNDRRRFKYHHRNDENEDLDSKSDYKINKNRSQNDHRLALNNFDFRDTTRRIARRKPRDRTINHELLDRDDQPDFKGMDSEEDPEDIEYEKVKHLQTTMDKPREFPGLIKISQKNLQEYDQYVDMKRVNSMKNKLPGFLRQTKEVVTVASVAERELKALLGHRQRKEVSSPLTAALPTTFPPNAVDPAFDDEWRNFIGNNSMRLNHNITVVVVIALINCFLYYGHFDCYSKSIVKIFKKDLLSMCLRTGNIKSLDDRENSK